MTLNCLQLQEISVDPNNRNFTSRDGVLFSKDGSVLIQYPAGRSGDTYSIPDGTVQIGVSAFAECGSLTCVNIPKSVKEIEYNAFLDFGDIKDIYYAGSESDWNAVKKAGCVDDHDALTQAVIHYNSDTPDDPAVRITKTDIKADRVFNNEGYGCLVIDGPDVDEYGEIAPDKTALINKTGVLLFPYQDFFGRCRVSSGIVSFTGESAYSWENSYNISATYYNVDGSLSFKLDDEYGSTSKTYHAGPLTDGYALVIVGGISSTSDGLAGSVDSSYEAHIVDSTGKTICTLPSEYGGHFDGMGIYADASLGWCGEGLFAFNYSTSNKQGYMDPTGKTVIDMKGRGYINLYPFSEGLAAVKNQNEKIGFIDKTGVLVIPCVFDAAGDFCDGLCPVQKDGKWGYIDKSGNVVIPLEYDDAYGAGSGLASVVKNGTCGLVDYDNNIVVLLDDVV